MPHRLGLLILVVTTALHLSGFLAWPHGGGLDLYGCHHNRIHGGYHCHRGVFKGAMFDTQAEMLQILETRRSRQSVVIDVPSLFGKSAREVRKLVESEHGPPDVDRPPITDSFGTLSWMTRGIRFGFDYHMDGTIGVQRDGAFILVGFTEQGYSPDKLLEAGNLARDASEYSVEIEAFGSILEIRVTPRQ